MASAYSQTMAWAQAPCGHFLPIPHEAYQPGGVNVRDVIDPGLMHAGDIALKKLIECAQNWHVEVMEDGTTVRWERI